MKKVTKYICEFCGSELSDPKECELHENRHKRPICIDDSLNSMKYMKSDVDANYIFPRFIDVYMDDGSCHIYEYHRPHYGKNPHISQEVETAKT